MARRRTRDRRPLLAGLIAANVLVGLTALGLWWRKAQPEPRAASAVPTVTAVAPAATARVDWDRFRSGTVDPDGRCVGCNVLLISLDIFRPDRLPCWGGPHETGDTICSMAENGVVFEDFIVQAYQTPIAQMAMFTGRYPSRTGFTRFSAQLPADEPSLPEAFAAAGYDTVAMGSSFEVMTDMSKWSKHGHRFTRDDLNPGLSFGRGFSRFVYTGYRNLPTDALPFLTTRTRGEAPFFLWLVFGTLHWPYGAAVPADLRDRFDPPDYQGEFEGLSAPHFPLLSRVYRNTWYSPAGPVPLSEDDMDWVRARYDTGLRLVDDFLGQLLAAIPAEQAENTLVVLHGIHGEDLAEHGAFGHYDVYDTEVRQRLIILHPRRAGAPAVVDTPVEGVDLAPTLADLAGLALPALPAGEVLDGRSLREAVRTGEADPDRAALSERIPLWEDIFRHLDNMPVGYVARIRPLMEGPAVGDFALRTDRWKLIHRRARTLESAVSWWTEVTGMPLERPELELYDLHEDPLELNDVAADHPEVVATLRAALNARLAGLDLPPEP